MYHLWPILPFLRQLEFYTNSKCIMSYSKEKLISLLILSPFLFLPPFLSGFESAYSSPFGLRAFEDNLICQPRAEMMPSVRTAFHLFRDIYWALYSVAVFASYFFSLLQLHIFLAKSDAVLFLWKKKVIFQLPFGPFLFSYSQGSVQTDPEPCLFINFDGSFSFFSSFLAKQSNRQKALWNSYCFLTSLKFYSLPWQALFFIQQRFIEHILCARHCSNHEDLVVNKTDEVPALN